MDFDEKKQGLGVEGSNARREPNVSEERFEEEGEVAAEDAAVPPKKRIGLFSRLIKVMLLTLFCLVAFLGWDYVYNKTPFFKKKIDEKVIPYVAKKYKLWFPAKKESAEPVHVKVKRVEPVKVEPVKIELVEAVVEENRPVHRHYPNRPRPKTFDFSKVKSSVSRYLSTMSGKKRSIEIKRLNMLNDMIHTVIEFSTKGGGYSVRGGMKLKIYTSRGSMKTLAANSLWGNKNEMLVRRHGHETKKLKWTQLHLDSCIDILQFALKGQEQVLAGTRKRSMRRTVKNTVSDLSFDLALIYDWYKSDPNAANSSKVKNYISKAIKNNKKMKESCVFLFPNYMEKMGR